MSRFALSRRVLLAVALLGVPAPALAMEVHEVARYDLFTARSVSLAGEMELATAADGHVLLGWTAAWPGSRESAQVQWLSREGLPLGPTIQATRFGSLRALAARPGHRALIVSSPPRPGYRLTFLDGATVVHQLDAADIGCDWPRAVTATGSGYFLACYSDETQTTHGWWLDDEPFAVRGRVEIGDIERVALAGGPRTSVTVLYEERDGPRLFARWMNLWRQEEPVLVDERGGFPAVANLRDGAFGIAWVHEYAIDPEDEDWTTRLTAVHAATFRAPGLVRSERRFSPLVGTAESSTGEQRWLSVLATGPKEQVIGWLGCSYAGSPAGIWCADDAGLFLRERRYARPSGPVVELSEVPAGSSYGYTGERLVTAQLLYRYEDDSYDLEVRVFAVE